MQIKEYESFTLKECLQQVRNDLGPDAVILETRKFRKGGLMGMGARDAVCIVAATGITVHNDQLPAGKEPSAVRREVAAPPADTPRSQQIPSTSARPMFDGTSAMSDTSTRPSQAAIGRSNDVPRSATSGQVSSAAAAAARNLYGRSAARSESERESSRGPHGSARRDTSETSAAHPQQFASQESRTIRAGAGYRGTAVLEQEDGGIVDHSQRGELSPRTRPTGPANVLDASDQPAPYDDQDAKRLNFLENAMSEIRDCLTSLQREQREGHERTVSAVVSAVAPAISAVSAAGYAAYADELSPRFPELRQLLIDAGVSENLVTEMLDELPDVSAWQEQAQTPMAISALRDLIARRVASSGPITLTPGRLKAVALIGPTGVGKTTTIAKLAAHFALVQQKKVALLTVDTYRIAAVEQLKTYSQIIDLPIAVAYSPSEVLPAIAQFADYDLILIDTAGRSQKNIMQVGELKSLLETIKCETHLVLSAHIKEKDMLEAAHRFSAARVDRLIFSKLDETSSYGTLLNVADRTGIPLSYLTTGQKVPEDLEIAQGSRLAELILD